MNKYNDFHDDFLNGYRKERMETYFLIAVVGIMIGVVLGYAWGYNIPDICPSCRASSHIEAIHSAHK